MVVDEGFFVLGVEVKSKEFCQTRQNMVEKHAKSLNMVCFHAG